MSSENEQESEVTVDTEQAPEQPEFEPIAPDTSVPPATAQNADAPGESPEAAPSEAPDAAPDAPAAPTAEAAPEPEPAGVVSEHPEASAELEELTLPSTVAALDPLPDGASPHPEGRLLVEKLRAVRGRTNLYLAAWKGDGGEPAPAELLEAPADHAALKREAEILSQVQYAMLPKLLGTWEQEGRRYLAIGRLEGPTLEQALGQGLDAGEIVSIVLQLTQVVRRLHQAGWAIVTLSPGDIYLGQPLRLTDLGSAVRIGEAPPHALQVAGYSAPEVAHQATVTGKEDVYTLAALLYHALAGEPVAEEGVELAGLAVSVKTPGAPQLLAPALAPVAERVDLEGFYQSLLGLRRRLSMRTLTLRVATGTTIGLNQTRLVNQDACGYLQWSAAYDTGMSYNAVLCMIDGMGGMEAGEVASRAALQSVLHGASVYATTQVVDEQEASANAIASAPKAAARPSLDPADLVKEAATAVHTAARGRAVGATITCTVVEDGKMTLAHVGDTRAYLLRNGVFTQITQDHSLVAAMVASGMLTKDEARGHLDSNKVLRSLGGQRTLPDEYIDDLSVAYGEEVLQLREGDYILMCSDGVWGTNTDDTLRDVVTEASSLESAVETILHNALEAGAPDNAAVLIAHCVTLPAG